MNDRLLNNKVLVIVGATATGKTSLALNLASKFNADLISADSRQVYRGLDIVTGKDIPEGFIPTKKQLPSGKVPIFTNGEVGIWGLDLVDPDQNWSAGAFKKFALAAIKKIHYSGRLPIVVGGTGLYIRSLVENLPLSPQPKAHERAKLDRLDLAELQTRLQREKPSVWSSMNQSDKKNKRRLVRALEIEESAERESTPLPYEFLIIGLRAPKEILAQRISQRVESRLEHDLSLELAYLDKFKGAHSSAKSAIGYELLSQFKQGKISRQQLIDLWTIREVQYAKRQQVWFKKQPDINWFDRSKKGWQSRIVAKVGSWYHQTYEH